MTITIKLPLRRHCHWKKQYGCTSKTELIRTHYWVCKHSKFLHCTDTIWSGSNPPYPAAHRGLH